MRLKIFALIAFMAMVILLPTGCSIKSIALNSVGDALSGQGTVFTGDNDPELVKDALPFALKLYESVLDGVPDHRPLTLATAKAFCMYAYAFIQTDAETMSADNYERALELKKRAKNLYLRARDYALKGLELNHNGFNEALKKDVQSAMAMTDKNDIELLYWCGAAQVAALTADKNDVSLMIDMQRGAAMVSRVLELDETFDSGAAHDFFISYDGGRSPAMGGSEQRAREHFVKAVELSGGKKAGPYISLATSVSVTNQNAAEWNDLLNKALAIDVDKDPASRLANIIYQKRAKWLLAHTSDYFINEPE